MITTEIINFDNRIEIYYRNEEYIVIRHLILDLNKNIIQDELSEYTSDGKILTSMVFASDYVTILGYRQYYYDKHSNELGFSDYRRVNKELKLVQRTENTWLKENEKLRCNFYNGNNELVFYELFELVNDEMIIQGIFDKNDAPISRYTLPMYTDY